MGNSVVAVGMIDGKLDIDGMYDGIVDGFVLGLKLGCVLILGASVIGSCVGVYSMYRQL